MHQSCTFGEIPTSGCLYYCTALYRCCTNKLSVDDHAQMDTRMQGWLI